MARFTVFRAGRQFEQNVIGIPLRPSGDLGLHVVIPVSFKVRTQQITAKGHADGLSTLDRRVGWNLIGNFRVKRAS